MTRVGMMVCVVRDGVLMLHASGPPVLHGKDAVRVPISESRICCVARKGESK